jgi:hypothetical protein
MGGARTTARDFVMQGSISLKDGENTEQGTVTIKLSGTSKSRIDYSLPSKTASYVLNGGDGREIREGRVTRLSRHATLNARTPHLPILSELSEIGDPAYKLTMAGPATLEGRSVLHVRVERDFRGRPAEKAKILSELAAVDFFFDPATFHLLKRSQVGASMVNLKQTWLVEYTYSDYRVVAGVAVPHLITQYVNGQVVSEIKVTRVEVNSGVSPADFEVR